ncbi:uncharacterized protein LOC144335255 isoform X1 [Macaca mulatta]
MGNSGNKAVWGEGYWFLASATKKIVEHKTFGAGVIFPLLVGQIPILQRKFRCRPDTVSGSPKLLKSFQEMMHAKELCVQKITKHEALLRANQPSSIYNRQVSSKKGSYPTRRIPYSPCRGSPGTGLLESQSLEQQENH